MLVSLKLLDSWWDVGAVTAPLLLRAPEDGTAEPSGVDGGLGGPARTLQHLVPVCAVTAPAQGLENGRGGAEEARRLLGRHGCAIGPTGHQAEAALVRHDGAHARLPP